MTYSNCTTKASKYDTRRTTLRGNPIDNVIPLEHCTYDKLYKQLTISIASGYKPDSETGLIYVISHKTQRVVTFTSVPFGHRLYDEDGYDGEQFVFIPVDGESPCNVDSLIILNTY